MIIIFEGLDRCGKTTQLQKLAERLQYEKNQVFTFVEPGSTPVGEIIRNDIIKSQLKLNPITQIFLFAAARSELSAALFKKFTTDELYGPTNIILIDRWKASTFAYQGAKFWSNKSYVLNTLLNIINKTNDIASFDIRPNLSLFFELDLETIKLRLQSETSTDIFTDEKELFYKRVAEMYNRYIFENDKNENFVKINTNNKNIDRIHEEVYNTIQFYRKQLNKVPIMKEPEIIETFDDSTKLKKGELNESN
jgi:dTMP kinase